MNNATNNTNNAANVAAPVEILVRLETSTKTPIVFIAQTFNGSQLEAWRCKGNKVEMVSKHEYDTTAPLAKVDEEAIAAQYEQQFGVKADIRSRLPRQQRERVALFAVQTPAATQQTPAPQAAPTPAPTPAPVVTPTPAPAATAPVNADVAAMSSVELLDKIKDAGNRVQAATVQVGELSAQLAQATRDHDTASSEHASYMAAYETACKRETEEIMRQRATALQAVLQHAPEAPAPTPAPAPVEATPAPQEAPKATRQRPARKAAAKTTRKGSTGRAKPIGNAPAAHA